MRTPKDISPLASPQSRLALTLKRLVRSVSSLSGEFGTSAFSLAMLVFLVQEARASALSQDGALAFQPMDTSDLDAVRQVFGDSAADQVVGIDYSAIADAVAQIEQLYAEEALPEGVADVALDGADANLSGAAQGLDTEMDLVGRYLQDAVQYAQLSTEAVAAAGAETAVTAEVAATSAAMAGFANALPFLVAGLGFVAATQTSSGVVGMVQIGRAHV